MRRYAVTLAWSVRPGVRQSTVIEVEASTTLQARLQTQRSHPGSTVTKILAIAVPVRNPWNHRHSRLTHVFNHRMGTKV